MVNLIRCKDVRSQEGLKIAVVVGSRNESRTRVANGFAQKVEYHPRQWVDCSDPLYFDLATQMLAQDNFVTPIRNDLNNPPTSVGGIHEAALLLAVDRI